MFKNLIIGLLLSIIGVHAIAQEAVFTILASKGTCIVQRAENPDSYVPLESGLKIFKGDKIIVTGDESYVSLVTSEGKALEINKGGAFNTNKLEEQVNSNSNDVASKYVQYLAESLTKKNEQVNQQMGVTGSVERSWKKSELFVYAPKNSKVFSNEVTVRWKELSGTSEYNVQLLNMFDEVVFGENVNSSQISFSILDLDLQPTEVYKLIISSLSDPAKKSSVITLEVPSKDEVAKMQNEVKDIQQAFDANSALYNVVLATYFDKSGMYLNAMPLYQKAIETEPEVEAYQDLYNDFLFRVGLGDLSIY